VESASRVQVARAPNDLTLVFENETTSGGSSARGIIDDDRRLNDQRFPRVRRETDADQSDRVTALAPISTTPRVQ